MTGVPATIVAAPWDPTTLFDALRGRQPDQRGHRGHQPAREGGYTKLWTFTQTGLGGVTQTVMLPVVERRRPIH